MEFPTLSQSSFPAVFHYTFFYPIRVTCIGEKLIERRMRKECVLIYLLRLKKMYLIHKFCTIAA